VKNDDSQADLIALVDAACLGSLDATQASRLECLLAEDHESRCLYIRRMALHTGLYCQILPLTEPKALLPGELVGFATSSTRQDVDSEEELLVSTESIRSLLEEDGEVSQREAAERARVESLAAEKFSAFQRERDRNRRPETVADPRSALYATVSSLAAAAILFIFWMLPDPIPVEPAPVSQPPVLVAQIVGANELVWSNEDAALPLEADLHQGQMLDLAAGLLEIEFGDGARLILEGPAKFVVQSRDAGGLQLGKLVAHVPDEARGFTIQTPGVKIVDLGTEFGVSVDEKSDSEMTVLEGEVTAQTARAKLALLAGQAVRTQGDNRLVRAPPSQTYSKLSRQLAANALEDGPQSTDDIISIDINSEESKTFVGRGAYRGAAGTYWNGLNFLDRPSDPLKTSDGSQTGVTIELFAAGLHQTTFAVSGVVLIDDFAYVRAPEEGKFIIRGLQPGERYRLFVGGTTGRAPGPQDAIKTGAAEGSLVSVGGATKTIAGLRIGTPLFTESEDYVVFQEVEANAEGQINGTWKANPRSNAPFNTNITGPLPWLQIAGEF